MDPLKNIRIKNKIIIIIVVIGALSTIAGSLINYFYEIERSKEQLISNTLLQAKLIGEYCGLPLEFNYPGNAADVLGKLESIPDIRDGILFTIDDSVFASYHRPGTALPLIPANLKARGSLLQGNYIHVMLPVVYERKHYGTIYLRAYIDWEYFVARRLVVTLAIIGIMLVIIISLASVLHRNISEPIVELTEKMNAVAKNKDYTVQFHTSGRDEVGELYTGFNTMLTEIKKREAELKTILESLRMSEEQFRATFDQAAVGIAHMALDGHWLRVNNRLCTITGYTREELLKKSFRDITHPDDIGGDIEYVRQLVAGAISTYSREKRYIRKDGSEVWVNLTVSLLREQTGEPKYLIAVTEDVTDRKRAEEAQKVLETHLFRVQRTESIGTLAAGIAHDFNNILNVIMGNADLLANMPGNSETVQRRIDSIAKAADRGSHVVKQLLTVARKADIQYLPIDVNEIIVEVTKLIEETFPKTIEPRTSLSPLLPFIIGDSNQIHQVLLNLCVNARDAMPGGGSITFATAVVDGAAIIERFPTAEQLKYISVGVTDTGSGMDEATLKRIFDPFFTTKEKGKGTGLGLAVAIGIVESHRGFIDVHSEPGRGTAFTLYLPAVDRRDTADTILLTADVSEARGSETILFIEDEQLIRELIVPVLSDNGYTVLTACDGEEGISMFQRHSGEISLVLSDYGLPKCDGEEVFKRVRLIDADVSFVVLTGFMGPDKRAELSDIGVTATISKPYKPADLLITVRDILDSHRS
jgi:PAS domain S-box-containing protein